MTSGKLAITGFDVDITVNRPSGPITYVKGRAIIPAVTSIQMKASVQQTSADNLLLLPEAIRNNETKKIYSYEEIRTATDETDPTDADIILYGGESWRVVMVDKYKMGTLDHWRVFAQKLDTDHN